MEPEDKEAWQTYFIICCVAGLAMLVIKCVGG